MASKSLLSEPVIREQSSDQEESHPIPQSLLSNTLRILRLHMFRWRNTSEIKKVAIYQSRRAALLHSLLHVLPLTGALTLVIINLRVVPIPYRLGQSANIPMIQLTAKVLEVLIQASIAAIILGLVRRAALGSRQLPLGALVAPYKITDFSYLWSLEFLGLLTSRGSHVYKTLLCIMVPFSLLLAAAVGPASAVLMIPRTVDVPQWSILEMLEATDVVYPTVIDLEEGQLR